MILRALSSHHGARNRNAAALVAITVAFAIRFRSRWLDDRRSGAGCNGWYYRVNEWGESRGCHYCLLRSRGIARNVLILLTLVVAHSAASMDARTTDSFKTSEHNIGVCEFPRSALHEFTCCTARWPRALSVHYKFCQNRIFGCHVVVVG